MGEWFYANILKQDGVTLVAKNIYVQMEPVEAKEASEYQGGDPHFTYHFFTRMLPTSDFNLVQQKYYVVDLQTIDPTTGKHMKYLIISDPHSKTLMMSWEWVAYRYRGT